VSAFGTGTRVIMKKDQYNLKWSVADDLNRARFCQYPRDYGVDVIVTEKGGLVCKITAAHGIAEYIVELHNNSLWDK